MSQPCYVIGNATAEPWLLNLEPYPSVERAERAISWQRIGQGHFDPPDYWRIVMPDEMLALLPHMLRSPYTERAWTAFITEMVRGEDAR